MNLLLVAMLIVAEPAAGPDTLVVCPPALRAAMQPWIEYRQGCGHQAVVAEHWQDAAEIRGEIRKRARDGRLKYVVLVGDAPAGSVDARRTEVVPTHHLPSKVNVRWGFEAEIASDGWYADLDDDQVPDLAIGRLTADTPGELAAMVEKIRAHEEGVHFGTWRRRLNFVAGLGGFGPVADTAVENVAKALITGGIPDSYATTMTYANWRSPYCPAPHRFHETTVRSLDEGCLFWVYLGHGSPQRLDSIRVPGGGQQVIFDVGDMEKLRNRAGRPVAVFLACQTGAFDQREDCLAEALLRCERGPVAVLAGSRMTLPYGMAVLGMELMDQYFQGQHAALGDVVLAAKREMITGDRTSADRRRLDLLAKALSPVRVPLAEERREHSHLFNLFGDPLLRMQRPLRVEIDVPKEVDAGDELLVRGTTPCPGRCTVELAALRGRLTFQRPRRRAYDASTVALTVQQRDYERANDPCYCRERFVAADGTFETVLQVPDDLDGPCRIRVFVEGTAGFAVGSADVVVKPGR